MAGMDVLGAKHPSGPRLATGSQGATAMSGQPVGQLGSNLAGMADDPQALYQFANEFDAFFQCFRPQAENQARTRARPRPLQPRSSHIPVTRTGTSRTRARHLSPNLIPDTGASASSLSVTSDESEDLPSSSAALFSNSQVSNAGGSELPAPLLPPHGVAAGLQQGEESQPQTGNTRVTKSVGHWLAAIPLQYQMTVITKSASSSLLQVSKAPSLVAAALGSSDDDDLPLPCVIASTKKRHHKKCSSKKHKKDRDEGTTSSSGTSSSSSDSDSGAPVEFYWGQGEVVPGLPSWAHARRANFHRSKFGATLECKDGALVEDIKISTNSTRDIIPGSHLSSKLRNKILNGRYADIFKLMPNECPGKVGKISNFGKRKYIAPKVERSFENWLDCFQVFAGVVSAVYPKRALHLIVYQSQVRKAYTMAGEEAAITYDKIFSQESCQGTQCILGSPGPRCVDHLCCTTV